MMLSSIFMMILLQSGPTGYISCTMFVRDRGPDTSHPGECIVQAVLIARGAIYYPEYVVGHLRGDLGYRELPGGYNRDESGAKYDYDQTISVSSSVRNGRNATMHSSCRIHPTESIATTNVRSHRATCNTHSGGGGSGGGIDCEIGVGGTGGSTLELSDDTSCVSPILIDLGGDGFAFGGPENPVIFDLLGMGHPLVLQWVQPGGNDAFLVNDLNGNGFVDDGAELFGNGSRMQLRPGELAVNGFQALAQWDQAALGGNDDGVVTRDDLVWQQLLLWVDADADGISQADELWPVERLRTLHTIPVEDAVYDAHDNLLLFWSQAQSGRRGYTMVDVFFRLL